MKMLRVPLLVIGLLMCAQGFAATPAQQAQQDKMKACNADPQSKGLTKDAHNAFMSKCLKATPAAAATPEKQLTPQQKKMQDCNADPKSKGLTKDERNAFMSKCLKN
ncbi:PsiF family protein [Pseudomonas sp. NA-150]|uniref:PsiF family protein n=1 Tax=Pseudomonas sp. NA-150 TaxID=3367525 RepID=UPI0037C500DB